MVFVDKLNILLGLSAKRNSLSEAGSVTSSLVRKLKRQEIKTKNGPPQTLRTIVTDGTVKCLVSFFKILMIVSIAAVNGKRRGLSCFSK